MSKERLVERHGELVCCPENVECTSICDDCDYMGKMMNKLAEYEDLEEQNLLLRLPCKVGDTVWEIVDECEGDSAGCYGTCDACHNRRLGIKETKFTIDMTDEVGNWFFLTQSEAEEKLRELEKNR